MKKAKLILTAITVFTVVAGALAFKAKNAYSSTIYTGSSATNCTNSVAARITASGVGAETYATTVSGGTGCSLTFTIADAN